jgi:HK97 family phage portal protein
VSVFRRERRTIENPLHPLTSTALIDMFGRAGHSGVTVTETSALNFSAVYRAVNTIAGQAAGLPLKTYRNEPGGRVETRTILLEQPYPDCTPYNFWELAYWDLLLWGNAYLYKVRSELGGPYDIAKLLRIRPDQVTVTRDEATATNPSGKWFKIGEEKYTPAEVMHIPGPGYDGLVGLSAVRCGAEGIGVAFAAEEAAARLYAAGILASGILSTEQDLKPEQARGIAEAFKEAVGGLSNARKVAVLPRGISFEQLTIPPGDAQFLESREFQVVEIARWFGVTPALLMDPTATMNWGDGAKQQFVTFTLNPWLKRVEQAVTLHLVPRGQFAEYTRAGLLESDLATQSAAFATAVQFGWLSRAEVRRYLNLPAGPPELDVFLSPANLGGAANGQSVPGEDVAQPALEEETADV